MRSPASSPRAYARRLAFSRWHSASEWRALDSVVSEESGWDPCAVNPGRHLCSYRGAGYSCGIPQAKPCPRAWWGRLFAARWDQVRWLISYITHRYGSPLRALWFHAANGWY